MTVLVAPEMWMAQGPATDVEALKLRTSAAAFRRVLDGMLSARQGVVYSRGTCQDLKALATGTPDGFIHVNLGACYVRGTQAATQGMYHVYNDATFDINVLGGNPAHATLDRIDLVVARMQDQFYSGSLDVPTIEMVTGTPAGSPAVPAAPANSLILAQLSIIHATTTIPQSVITDRRVPAGNGPIVLDDILVGTDSRYVAATAQVDFLNSSGVGTNLIPPGFSHLEVLWQIRESGSVSTGILVHRFNGDSGNNYYSDRTNFSGTGTALSSSGESLAISTGVMGIVGGASLGDGGLAGGGRLVILNPSSAVFKKQFLNEGAVNTGTATGTIQRTWQWGYWNSLATISRLSVLLNDATNLVVGSRLTLIGHPGLQP